MRSSDGAPTVFDDAGAASLAALHTNEAYAATQSSAPTSAEVSPVRARMRGRGGGAAPQPSRDTAASSSSRSGESLERSHDGEAVTQEVGTSEEVAKMVSVPVTGEGDWSAGIESPAAQAVEGLSVADDDAAAQGTSTEGVSHGVHKGDARKDDA